MTNLITLTEEELSKVISVAILGFVGGVMHQPIPIKLKDLHEATVTSIQEGMHDELIQSYDAIIADEENEYGNG